MSLNTLSKRLSTQLDVGIPGYPDGTIGIGDRAYLTSVWWFYDIPIWQRSYLGRINYSFLTALDTIGDTNQEDFNKATFPLYNLYLIPEETTALPSQHLNLTSYRFKAKWEIHCFNKTVDGTNTRFDHDYVLLQQLRDVKNLLGTNILYDVCERVDYKGFSIIAMPGNDIIIPQKLVIRIETTYSQQRQFPALGVSEC